MPREKVIRHTALNIRIHPHTEEKYVYLFKEIFSLRQKVNLRGDTYAMMTRFDLKESTDGNIVIGELTTFTDISPDGWYNLKELRAAEENETKRILIPESMAANHKTFNFIFNPKKHYLIIETYNNKKSITAKIISKYFDTIFKNQHIASTFETIHQTVVPDKNALDQVFGLKRISALTYTIRRPNPDVFDPDLENATYKDLQSQNIDEIVTIQRASKGLSVSPNSRTKSLCQVAQLNGEVEAKGQNENGKAITRSTKEHAFENVSTYNSNTTIPVMHLLSIAESIYQQIRSLLR